MAAFDHRHVADGYPGLLGESFLRHLAFFAKLANGFAQGGLGLVGAAHGWTVSNAGVLIHLTQHL